MKKEITICDICGNEGDCNFFVLNDKQVYVADGYDYHSIDICKNCRKVINDLRKEL